MAEVTTVVSSLCDLDRSLITTSVAEINKRADRLKENLVLPKLDDKAKETKPLDVRDDNGLQAGLLQLDNYVMSFVTNPLFKQPNVVDVQLAKKARNDLEFIISLSEEIKNHTK